MALAKAQGLQSVARAIRELCRPDVYEKFLAALSPAAQQFVTNPPVAGTWVDIALQDEMLRLAREVCYAGDLSKCEKQGEVQASLDFKTVYRAFIKLLDPEYLIRRADLMWKMFYKDNGGIRVVNWNKEQQWALLAIEGVAIPSPAFWAHQLGGMRTIASLTRLREVRASISEGGGNEPSAVIRIEWKR